MSEVQIGIICEGTSDYEVLNEIICNKLCKRENCLPLQPPQSSYSPGGWGNVWKYCIEKIGPIGFFEYLKSAGRKLDALVVALDGDCTREKTLYCDVFGKPLTLSNIECLNNPNAHECYKARSSQENYVRCEYNCPEHPQIEDSCIDDRDMFLSESIKHWLGLSCEEKPKELILAIPIDSIENWIVCALDGEIIGGIKIEDFTDIFRKHIKSQPQYHGISTANDDLLIKNKIAKRFAVEVCHNWGTIARACKQSKRFEDQLFAIM